MMNPSTRGFGGAFASRSGESSGSSGKAAFNIVARFATGKVLGETRERTPRVLNLVLPPQNAGKPITEEIAIDLRRVVFGQCPASARPDMFAQGPGLVFREHGYPLAYGLILNNYGASPMIKAIVMAIQSHILRILIFEPAILRLPKTSSDPLKPSSAGIQQDVLAAAISEIIWRAGDGEKALLCLPQPSTVHVTSSARFNEDGLTERLQILEMDRFDDLYLMIRRNIHVFQEDPGPGLLLVMYSTVLTRGINQVIADLGKPLGGDGSLTPMKCVMGNTGAISFSAISLYLIGTASPYLHNGVQESDDGQGNPIEEKGAMIRSPLGLLVWMGNEEKTAAMNLGSRLKTPTVPIWLVICGEQSGVVFAEDKGLLRDYQAENRFYLHYYTSTFQQPAPVNLKINNRAKDDSDASATLMERVLRTKWSDARLEWGSVEPFV